MAKANQAKSSPRRRVIHGILAGILILLVVLPLWLFFSGRPDYAVPPLQPLDWSLQARVLMREMPRMMKSKPGERLVLKLTPEEVNSLLRFVANQGNLTALFDPRSSGAKGGDVLEYQAVYRKDGNFEVRYAYDTGLWPLFGGYLILDVNAQPGLADGKINLEVDRAAVGGVTLPKSLADKLGRRIIDELRDRREVRDFLAVVERIEIDEAGNVSITYVPYALAERLFGKKGK